MNRPRLLLINALALVAMWSTGAYAQSAFTGVVKDATGGVLPGVTVEASSPALIEKTKTALTDTNGQYRIVELRPGTYSVTFTLPGFGTVRREGIELVASFTATINITLSPGDVQESVTVTGATPLIDTTNALQQTVLTRTTLDTIPNSRNIFHQATLIPGVQSDRFDVGGTEGLQEATVRVHGSQASDQNYKVDGMSLNSPFGDGRTIGIYFNDGNFQEVSFQTSALPAEMAQGGISFNMVMRDGGNDYRGYGYFGGSSAGMNANNLNDELRQRGLPEASELIKIYDANVSFGGPVKRDRLWFFLSNRYQRFDQYEAGLNPDGSRPLDDNTISDLTGRLTLQVNQKNKITAFYETDDKWRGGRRDRSADFQFIESRAAILQETPNSYVAGAKVTSTLSNKVLTEVGLSLVHITSHRGPQEEVAATDIPRIDFIRSTLTNSWTNDLLNRSFMGRLNSSVSYVTGAHNLKVGLQYGRGSYTRGTDGEPGHAPALPQRRRRLGRHLELADRRPPGHRPRARPLCAGRVDVQTAHDQSGRADGSLSGEHPGADGRRRAVRSGAGISGTGGSAQLDQRRAAVWRRLRHVRHRQDRAQGQPEQVRAERRDQSCPGGQPDAAAAGSPLLDRQQQRRSGANVGARSEHGLCRRGDVAPRSGREPAVQLGGDRRHRPGTVSRRQRRSDVLPAHAPKPGRQPKHGRPPE